MFRSAAAILVCCALGRAGAEPVRRLELGARIGVQSTALNYDDDAPRGDGAFFDTSVGWRIVPWLSVSVYAALSSIHDEYTDPFMGPTHDARVRFIEVGPRISVHLRGLFAGFGVASNHLRTTTASGVIWEDGLLREIHAGYTSPRIRALGGIAFQVFFMKTTASTAYPGESIDSTRVAIGVEM